MKQKETQSVCRVFLHRHFPFRLGARFVVQLPGAWPHLHLGEWLAGDQTPGRETEIENSRGDFFALVSKLQFVSDGKIEKGKRNATGGDYALGEV